MINSTMTALSWKDGNKGLEHGRVVADHCTSPWAPNATPISGNDRVADSLERKRKT